MSKLTAPPDLNSWLEEELYQQFRNNQGTVDESWKSVFRANPGNGETAVPVAVAAPAPAAPAAPAAAAASEPAAPSIEAAKAVAPSQPAITVGPSEQLVPLKGAAGRLALNMAASLAVPTATSQRSVPVKVIEENRRLINQHQAIEGQGKVSYSHLLGWAIVQALKRQPGMNDAFAESKGENFRIVRKQINLGIAIDVATSATTRSLVVPSIKNAGERSFAEYKRAFDDLVQRGRKGKLTVDDFAGTTISLTNPGTVGTFGSVPRLMPGQGCIIASGAIDFPAEFQGASPDVIASLGLSKVMMLTCTYDHRIIQGAESGTFLGTLQDLLQGSDGFYSGIFADLHIPFRPVVWRADQRNVFSGTSAGRPAEIAKEAAILQLIHAFRERGHLVADLDPLGKDPGYHPELDPETYGLSVWDLDRQFITGNLGALTGDASPKPVATLREILDTLRQTYCARIGVEYMNIQAPEQKRWLQKRMEPEANAWPFSPEDKLRILERLISAELFEEFIHSRFVGQKRFSLEGAETAVALLDEMLDRAADDGVHEAVIGMAHRGRLNILANVVSKPLSKIFGEFEGHPDPMSAQGSGDVKYHLGATGVHRADSGRETLVTVAPNPSHLEAVGPVIEGLVRAKQDRLDDDQRARVLPISIHGDAAFAGQGVVSETLQLSQLTGYQTGGTIHLVINNQIGFTTRPDESRSSIYCTDIARTIEAPIFHVNGDDPEACTRAVEIAYDFRQQFHKDVVIDMVCYRRHGHNEGDDPSFTQPVMYRKIRSLNGVSEQYGERLVREGILSAEQLDKMRKRVSARLEEGFEEASHNAKTYEVEEIPILDQDHAVPGTGTTAAKIEVLERVLEGLSSFPAGFRLHPKLRSFVEKRREALKGGSRVDWALAEALALGSLVVEGTPVRLSGQDSGRGTFSQRHLELYDSENGDLYIPMQNLSNEQARFEVWDSSLSEFAVLGFEYGYSVGDPAALTLWEAQFGDFVNGAQVMIDQFISVSQMKWGQSSGLVMLLPHGYEGQGPEHSSARIERFLILTAEDNMQLVNCTTPAQYFHLLRRQMRGGANGGPMRKPLVVFTPKSLLRHPKVTSSVEELTGGSFREVLGETSASNPGSVHRVLICSGKVYYDLLGERERVGSDDVAIVRLEQLYPFPLQQVVDQIMRYPASTDIAWVQEEPRNMGGWRSIRSFVQPLLESSGRKLRYIGRPASASPATGSYKQHQAEQNEILSSAYALEQIAPQRKMRVVRKKR